MTLDEFKAHAAETYVQFRATIGALRDTKESVSWYTPDSVLALTETNLQLVERDVAKLGTNGSATQAVISGAKSAQWWEAQAETLRQTLNDTAKNLGESLPSWRRITGEIIRPTLTEARDVAKDAIEEAAEVLPWWVPWAVGGGLVLGVLILGAAYLPRPRG